jgi:hypothetical protein
MRDFKAGRDINVGGDVHINDQSNQPKLLALCTNEELFDEEQHRRKLLSDEKIGKLKGGFLLVLFAWAACGIYALWNHWQGNSNLGSFYALMATMFWTSFNIYIYQKPNEFEQRQMNTLKEITMLLRERDAR